MTAIPTDTYPAFVTVTEGYTQAPTPAPVQPTQAQQAYGAMSLQQLADAIQAKTGTEFKTGAELAAEQAEVEEQAKLDAQAEREAAQDAETITELCDAITARDADLAISLYLDLNRETMQASAMRAITHTFGAIVECPCCVSWRERVEADCDMCGDLGLVPQKRLDDEATMIAREHAAMVA